MEEYVNREIDFLNKLATAYRTYDASVIEEFLSEDVHYASFWVFNELKSKAEYMEYLKGKMETMKRTGKTLGFRIVFGMMHEYALLVLEEKVDCGFVVDFDDNGKVKMINMTTPEFF
ncbi:MAG: hypothetical protein MJZ41_09640 [Bacteroidaceae bacterium]|nr:hypothetical protein [Bacteroidaceae bacterium]